MARGENIKDLKKQWQALTAKERFQKRQEYLAALKK